MTCRITVGARITEPEAVFQITANHEQVTSSKELIFSPKNFSPYPLITKSISNSE